MNTSIQSMAITALLAASANAAVLFENPVGSPRSTPASNVVNTNEAARGQFAATKVVVTGAGWNIDTVSVYNNSGSAASFTGPFSAYLHIVEESALATYDPTSTTPVAATITVIEAGNFFTAGVAETVATAGVTLGPGTYWIGATPVLANPAFNGLGIGYRGQNVIDSVHYADASGTTNTSTTPNAVQTWEAIDGTADDTPFGIAIKIEGSVVPEPSSILLLGLGSLGLLRRRR